MVQVIGPGGRKTSFQEQLLGGLEQGLNAYSQYQDYKQQQQQQKAIAQQFPELAGLSPELQKAALPHLLKGRQPEKPLTPLQESQKKLADERLKALQGQQELFAKLSGGGRSRPEEQAEQQDESLTSAPEDILRQAAAFAGQPGEAGIVGNMAKSEIERREKESGRAFEREKLERHEAGEVTKPLMLELQNARKNIPLQEQAIEDIKHAVPEVGALDYLADVTGFEPLRSASGAKLKTAIKDFFLSDLTRAGSRPNQWIEQQLADALPKIGRSEEANLVVAEGMQFKVDLAKKRIELIDELSEQDKAKYGYVKADVDARASKLLKPYVEQRKKSLIDDIHKIKTKHKRLDKEAKNKKYIQMLSPEGEIWEILPSDVEEAEAHGYSIRK